MNESLSGEVLLFTSIAEYEQRPKYTAALTLAPGEVDRIVGKYELPADRARWASCGLNNCNTEHRFGYVILAKNGRETNIGQDCGRRELGVSFEEVEATYKRKEDAEARRRTIQTLLAEKPELCARADAALANGAVQAVRLDAFIRSLDHLHGFWKELIKAAKQGGIVRAAMSRDDKWNLGGGKEQLITVGRFRGSSVLVGDSPGTPKLVSQLVKPWVANLSEMTLGALSEAQLGATVREAARMRDLLGRAEAFVANCSEFLTADNVEGMESICDHVLRHVDAGYARPYLIEWVAQAKAGRIPVSPVKVHRQ